MDLTELWVGDLVEIISSNENGTFEGISESGLAKVKINGQIQNVISTELRLAKEEHKIQPFILKEEPPKTSKEYSSLPNSIDLHIEILRPDLTHALPQMILNHQCQACKYFIEEHIRSYSSSIEIIHGKGTGQLKQEVVHLLNAYTQVSHILPKKAGGAVEVWLKY